MDKAGILKKIVALVQDFRNDYDRHRNELEANTETKLIEPLFVILGWTAKDFVKREHARRGIRAGFVDYAFKIDDKTVFLLEVKKLGVPLEKEADTQVISYALSSRVPIAISTNFERMKVFCVEQENAATNVFRVFTKPEDYANNLQDLLFLHKESFEQNLLLRKAEDEGRLKKRISIDQSLLDDLMRIRSMIADDIEKTYPGTYGLNEREEIIQRIIDRLIFIRKCEDVGINPSDLVLEEIRHNPYGKAYARLKGVFVKYNEVYNSGLFAVDVDNDCDKITIDGEIVQNLIGLLYESRDRQYVYNFDWIGADILGQVYEQYLGKVLAQTIAGKSKLTDGQAHRKEQGIYYTPSFVVDYIVSNTVGSLLRGKKTKVRSMKVLDPACGSGSFLLKVFDYLKENLYTKEDAKLRRLDEQGMYSIRTEILKNNIYGVDLDEKAVEITKLNLLLKAAEKYRRLPKDDELHIRRGNSLISDETVAGLSAFKWEGPFQEGSFDVVLGNPPYIRIQTSSEEDRKYLASNYVSAQGKFDIYTVFIERALKLLKDDGLFSFIVPNKFTQTIYGKRLKELILRNFTIQRFIDFGDLKVFGEVTTYPCILVIKKTKPTQRTSGSFVRVKKLSSDIEQRLVSHQDDGSYEDEFLKVFPFKQKNLGLDVWSFMPGAVQNVFDKVKDSSKTTLRDLTERCVQGFITGNNDVYVLKNPRLEDFERRIVKKIPKGKNVHKYGMVDKGYYTIYPHEEDGSPFTEDKLLREFPKTFAYLKSHETELRKRRYYNQSIMELYGNWWSLVHPVPSAYFEQDKIITPNLAQHNHFTLDSDNLFIEHDCYILTLVNKDRRNYEFVLGILNSKVAEFFIRQVSPMFSGGYYKYHTQYIEQVPIVDCSAEAKGGVINLVEKALFLNKHLAEHGEKKTAETARITEEIRNVETEIDACVYSLYDITDGERKVIEECVNQRSDQS